MKKFLIFVALLLCFTLLASCNDTSSTGGNQDGGSQDGGNQDGGSQDGGSQDGGSQDGGSQGADPEKEKIKGYLSALLSGFRADPYSYLPESMVPGAGTVDPVSLTQNYTNGVQVSSIPNAGFGEQWNMIIENMAESQSFFNALSIVEGLTTTSVSAFNNYLDNNPADTASHTFKTGIYTVSIVYEDGVLDYVLDYKSGTFNPQIALSMDVASGDKTVRVQLSEANALRYVVTENSYEFAVRYAGIRRAYFSLERTDEGAQGHIYEYLTVSSVELVSAADFYITEDYVTAIGNKASGIPGFTGYICELYDAESGNLIGYEVKEKLSAISFDTLWFDLASFTGLNSIRYRPESGEGDQRIEAAFFVNGSDKAWKNKKVGGFNPLTLASRRFDIEFRDRFFYVYNAQEEKFEKVSVSVPMLFVQEKYYEDLAADVREVNDGVSLTSRVASADLAVLEEEYVEKVEIFAENKEAMSVDVILGFIGNKKTFE